MWTTENRQRYNRENLRYPSDLTDEEWSLVEQMIPSAKRGGRRREVDVREIPQWHHVYPDSAGTRKSPLRISSAAILVLP